MPQKKRKPVKIRGDVVSRGGYFESIHKVVGRVVASGIRDGYGLEWATRYAGITPQQHREWWARGPGYRAQFVGLDPYALPEDARPDGGNKS